MAAHGLIHTLHAWSRPRGSVIAREDLIARGVGSSRVGRLVDSGVLFFKHRGVYAVGRPDVPPYGEAWAAYLATRGRGAEPRHRGLTGRSGLALLGVCAVPDRPEVLVVSEDRPRIPGVRASCTRALERDELWFDGRGLAITSWSRSVLALAATASVAELQDVLDRSDRRGLLDVLALDELLARPRRWSGAPKLRRALEPFVGLPPAEYLSLLERLARTEFPRARLPEPEVNAPVRLPCGMTIRVDLLLRAEMLAIELDGRASHDRSRQFDTDRWRDRELQKLGYATPRFTWWDVTRRPEVMTRDVRMLILHRGARLPSR